MADDYRDGWAVSDADGIDIKTVSDTRRAAIVNWLVVKAKQFIRQHYTDQDIEDLFAAYADTLGGAVPIEVRVFARR